MSGFVPFLLIVFALAVILHNDFFFTVFYLFAGVYLLSRLWLSRLKKGLQVERSFAARVFPGEAVTVELRIKNSALLPVPWLELIEALPAELTPPWHLDLLHLGPRSVEIVSCSFTPRRRGYYPIGPLNVSTGDIFGILPQYRVQLPRDYLTVYPHIVPLQSLGLPTRSPLAVLPSTRLLFEDTSRVIGTRAYEPLDSPRHIHWTASASAGQLLVKRYQPAIARETLIFLDLNGDNYRERIAGTELAIVVAASLAHHIVIRERLPVGLATEANDPLPDSDTVFYLPPRPERAHLMHILEVLARLNPISKSSFTAQLRRERARLSYGATLVVITGRESAALHDTLLLMQRAGFAIALILIQAGRSAPVDQVRAPRGISIYHVRDQAALETIW